MTSKLILTTAVAAFMLSAGSLAVTSDAFAGHGGGRSGGGGHHLSFNGGHHDGGEHHSIDDHHNGHGDFHRRDHDGDERFAHRRHDHHRRFWHGTWYDYGVGSCWRWSDENDEYVWVCGDDD